MPKKNKQSKHRATTSLRDVILGGQDGLVNVLGLTLGLFAASAGSHLILVAGIAAALAESISMGAVVYTSSLAERDFFVKSKQDAKVEIAENPEEAKQILYDAYKSQGFEGALLDDMVTYLIAHEDAWADRIVRDGFKVREVHTKHLIFSSVVVAVSAIVGSVLPLLPFMFFSSSIAMVLALFLSAGILFIAGAYQAFTLVGSWWKTGFQMLVIGMISAFAGFLAGLILKGK